MEVAIIVVAIAVLALAAALLAVAVQRRQAPGETKRLDEYEFYPFTTDEAGPVHFSPERFEDAVAFFLGKRNPTAARELIVIGEQNRVRDTFSSELLGRYKDLYVAYDGEGVISDNEVFLENYKRIVRLIGQSFPIPGSRSFFTISSILRSPLSPSKTGR